MSKVKIKAGTTSYSVEIFVADSSSSTGAGLSTLTSATSGLTVEYRRRGASTWTAITLVGSGGGKVLGTWTSGGFLSDGQGMYELDLPNAVLATGATGAYVRLYGATNMLLTILEIELDAVDYQSATNFGLTNLDAAISSRSTYAGADTSGTTTLLSRLTSTRAGLLDNLDAAISSRSTLTAANIWDALLTGITTVGSVGKLIKDYLDAAISSRSTYAGGDTSGTTTLLARLTSTRAGLLDNLDATVSSRSTYAGGDTSGTTTLLSRLTSTRAGYLDNLANLTAAPPTSAAITTAVWAASTRTLTSGGGGGGAPVLYASPLSVVVEAGASDEQFLSLRRSHIGPVRVNLVDANKVPVPTTGATLSAKIYSPGGTQLLTGLTVTELLGDEGQVSVQVDMTDAALANYASVNLAVIRTNGSTDVTTATLAIRILG